VRAVSGQAPRPRSLRVAPAGLGVVLTALALAGCGLGAGPAPGGVQLTVTRDFGARVLSRTAAPRVVGQETAMSLLLRNDVVTSRYGGGFVESIDGLSGGQEGGRPVDWFYYVNGVEASKGAAMTNVQRGDHIWWDRHDWSQTEDVPAVVGSFPEPFLNGIDGKRLPVRVECAEVEAYACRTVTARLRARGVPAAIAAIGTSGAPETLRVIVGTWSQVEGDGIARDIERGPRASGVYARFLAGGRALTVLDQDGRPARTLAAGTGLIAATRRGQDAPVWVVAGTDAAGVDLAAGAFDERTLANRFAVALAPTGALAVPAVAR
jgi:Domain of unknown function (DUF4430)